MKPITMDLLNKITYLNKYFNWIRIMRVSLVNDKYKSINHNQSHGLQFNGHYLLFTTVVFPFNAFQLFTRLGYPTLFGNNSVYYDISVDKRKTLPYVNLFSNRIIILWYIISSLYLYFAFASVSLSDDTKLITWFSQTIKGTHMFISWTTSLYVWAIIYTPL